MGFISIKKGEYVRAEEVCRIKATDAKSCKLKIEDEWIDCAMSAEQAKQLLDLEDGGIKKILKQIASQQQIFAG